MNETTSMSNDQRFGKLFDTTTTLPIQTKFVSWLQQHVADVENGSAYYEGQHVTRESRVTRYYCCTSILFFMMNQMSGAVLDGSFEAMETRVRYTLITITLGCLGLGFFMVPYYLYKNIAGGYRLTVADLIDNTKRAQDAAADFEFGPTTLVVGVLGVVLVLVAVLQIIIFVHKHAGQ